MTSSMLAGERRWASTRRSSMTVLGKVAVPKPLNLPSQRLENHGLDPNVEIVPKGSLSWGSRSSSSASNPWGSSGLSPHGDGANGSPSYVSGRPSSGGSGTRPSTADSDRMHEPTPGAWGLNSRPSSASGALTSSQTSSTPLRPHSAETRPGSSQLSRFAEPLPDNSVAWGTGTVDKLIISSTKIDGFSLSSGDFPTLGSERENSGKNMESEDYGSHGRPSSSSGRVARANDRTVTSEADVKGGTMNTWKRDGTQHVEDGVQPSSEKWQGGDPQQYLNASVPQQFDAWHGSPINAPAGVWFRGPPGGPPYGPPVASGGFPIEPFPYYRPQMPPAFGNPQQVPQPLNGPRGHHPKNGDLYRAQIPDAYMHPGMPIRPGFYPHPVPYENYYGPPIAYCNPNERDIPFMGMATGPPVFNRYPAQNTPEPSNSHARAGGCGSNETTLVSEQVESGHSDDTRGPYKVLIKQHNEWDTKEGSWEHNAPVNVPFLEKGNQTTFRKNERGSDRRRDEEMHSKRTPLDENYASINFDNRGHSLNSVGVKSPERVDKAKAVDDSWWKKSETGDSSVSLSQVLPAALKDSTLLQKIKGLNDKARASNGCQDVAFTFSREDQKNRLQFDIPKANNSMIEVGTAVVCSERPHSGDLIAASNEAGVSKEHMIHQSTALTAISRREGRVDQRGKGRFNNPNADGWRKKPLVAECSTAIPTTNVGSVSTIHGQDHHTFMEAAERSEANLPVKDEGEFLAPVFDPSNCQAQMRGLTKQCAIQLRKEEEERIREQKAKALAKLEELKLNRCAQARDGSTQKLEKASPSRDILQDQEALQTLPETVMDAGRNEAPSLVLVSCRKEVAQISDNSNSGVGESSVLSRNSRLETSKNAKQNTLVPQSSPWELDVHHAGAADVTTAPQVNGCSVSRHKSSGYKQKQNIQVEKLTKSLIPFGTIGEPNIYSSVVLKDIISAVTVPGEVVPSCESNLSDNSNIIPESSAHQRKKIIKTGKNKSKLEDSLPVTALPSQVSREPNLAKASSESGKAKSTLSELDPGSVQSVAKAVAHFSDQPSSLPCEESHVKINYQWKAQQSRRMPRNGQANKVADKFHGNDTAVWAPVRSHHKAESADEASQKTVPDAVIVTAKGDNLGQNSIKSKRAEMERYVPKPVAKELGQPGSIQQSVSSSFSQTTSNEMISREDSNFQRTESSLLARSVVENLGRTAEFNSGDDKQNKQAKSHGAWRQRGSVESSRMQMGSSLTSNLSKNVQKYMDQHESLKPEVNHVKIEPNISDGWDTSDSSNMPEDPNAAPAVTSGMKDQGGVKGKGKRHPYMGHKSTGNKHDLDQTNNNSGEMNKSHIQPAALETSQEERSVIAKESGNGERASSQWQPKSLARSANTQTGSRSSGGQHISTEADQAIKKDSHPMDRDPPSTQDKVHSEVVPELHSDQSVSNYKYVGEAASNTRHQEGRRERKVASSKELPQHPRFGLVSTDEQAPPESGDAHLEQQISLGFRKHGNQNNWSGRGYESRGEWNSVAQDNRHCNLHGNRELQSQNSHYVYQPVGSHNFSKANNFEGPTTDGSHNIGSRYRGRGHSRRGGGNSYGRQNDSTQVDAGYD